MKIYAYIDQYIDENQHARKWKKFDHEDAENIFSEENKS